jgi:hypothetical protein
MEILCRETGLSNDAISRVVASNDDAKLLFKDISEYVAREKTEKEKLITNIQNLRRARVNAGKVVDCRSLLDSCVSQQEGR